jgi:DeoR family transcriptional regulator, glycerol-3-phosphate regulon repressor
MKENGRFSKSARQRQILSDLRLGPTLRVADLANQLGVSTETIRRDLDDLTDRGLLNRTYGGAVRPYAAEPALESRHRLLVTERTAIARAVVRLIEPGQAVAIGAGATTARVAQQLAADLRDLTVLVHSFGVAAALAANDAILTLVCPGRYHGEEAAIHGPQAMVFLQSFRANWAILGASGITSDGPADVNPDAAAIYAAMSRRAERSIVVADHTKFDRPALAIYAPWREIDVLVADRKPAGKLARALYNASVKVIVAA